MGKPGDTLGVAALSLLGGALVCAGFWYGAIVAMFWLGSGGGFSADLLLGVAVPAVPVALGLWILRMARNSTQEGPRRGRKFRRS